MNMKSHCVHRPMQCRHGARLSAVAAFNFVICRHLSIFYYRCRPFILTLACQQQTCFSLSPSSEWFSEELWTVKLQNCIQFCTGLPSVNFYLSFYLWHLPDTLSFVSLQVSSISGSTIIHFISEDTLSLKFIYLFSPGRDTGHQYASDTGSHLCFPSAFKGFFTTTIKSRPIKNWVWDSMETTHSRESEVRQGQWCLVEKPVSTRRAFAACDSVTFLAGWNRGSIPPTSQPCKTTH